MPEFKVLSADINTSPGEIYNDVLGNTSDSTLYNLVEGFNRGRAIEADYDAKILDTKSKYSPDRLREEQLERELKNERARVDNEVIRKTGVASAQAEIADRYSTIDYRKEQSKYLGIGGGTVGKGFKPLDPSVIRKNNADAALDEQTLNKNKPSPFILPSLSSDTTEPPPTPPTAGNISLRTPQDVETIQGYNKSQQEVRATQVAYETERDNAATGNIISKVKDDVASVSGLDPEEQKHVLANNVGLLSQIYKKGIDNEQLIGSAKEASKFTLNQIGSREKFEESITSYPVEEQDKLRENYNDLVMGSGSISHMSNTQKHLYKIGMSGEYLKRPEKTIGKVNDVIRNDLTQVEDPEVANKMAGSDYTLAAKKASKNNSQPYKIDVDYLPSPPQSDPLSGEEIKSEPSKAFIFTGADGTQATAPYIDASNEKYPELQLIIEAAKQNNLLFHNGKSPEQSISEIQNTTANINAAKNIDLNSLNVDNSQMSAQFGGVPPELQQKADSSMMGKPIADVTTITTQPTPVKKYENYYRQVKEAIKNNPGRPQKEIDTYLSQATAQVIQEAEGSGGTADEIEALKYEAVKQLYGDDYTYSDVLKGALKIKGAAIIPEYEKEADRQTALNGTNTHLTDLEQKYVGTLEKPRLDADRLAQQSDTLERILTAAANNPDIAEMMGKPGTLLRYGKAIGSYLNIPKEREQLFLEDLKTIEAQGMIDVIGRAGVGTTNSPLEMDRLKQAEASASSTIEKFRVKKAAVDNMLARHQAIQEAIRIGSLTEYVRPVTRELIDHAVRGKNTSPYLIDPQTGGVSKNPDYLPTEELFIKTGKKKDIEPPSNPPTDAVVTPQVHTGDLTVTPQGTTQSATGDLTVPTVEPVVSDPEQDIAEATKDVVPGVTGNTWMDNTVIGATRAAGQGFINLGVEAGNLLKGFTEGKWTGSTSWEEASKRTSQTLKDIFPDGDIKSALEELGARNDNYLAKHSVARVTADILPILLPSTLLSKLGTIKEIKAALKTVKGANILLNGARRLAVFGGAVASDTLSSKIIHPEQNDVLAGGISAGVRVAFPAVSGVYNYTKSTFFGSSAEHLGKLFKSKGISPENYDSFLASAAERAATSESPHAFIESMGSEFADLQNILHEEMKTPKGRELVTRYITRIMAKAKKSSQELAEGSVAGQTISGSARVGEEALNVPARDAASDHLNTQIEAQYTHANAGRKVDLDQATEVVSKGIKEKVGNFITSIAKTVPENMSKKLLRGQKLLERADQVSGEAKLPFIEKARNLVTGTKKSLYSAFEKEPKLQLPDGAVDDFVENLRNNTAVPKDTLAKALNEAEIETSAALNLAGKGSPPLTKTALPEEELNSLRQQLTSKNEELTSLKNGATGGNPLVEAEKELASLKDNIFKAKKPEMDDINAAISKKETELLDLTKKGNTLKADKTKVTERIENADKIADLNYNIKSLKASKKELTSSANREFSTRSAALKSQITSERELTKGVSTKAKELAEGVKSLEKQIADGSVTTTQPRNNLKFALELIDKVAIDGSISRINLRKEMFKNLYGSLSKHTGVPVEELESYFSKYVEADDIVDSLTKQHNALLDIYGKVDEGTPTFIAKRKSIELFDKSAAPKIQGSLASADTHTNKMMTSVEPGTGVKGIPPTIKTTKSPGYEQALGRTELEGFDKILAVKADENVAMTLASADVEHFSSAVNNIKSKSSVAYENLVKSAQKKLDNLIAKAGGDALRSPGNILKSDSDAMLLGVKDTELANLISLSGEGSEQYVKAQIKLLSSTSDQLAVYGKSAFKDLPPVIGKEIGMSLRRLYETYAGYAADLTANTTVKYVQKLKNNKVLEGVLSDDPQVVRAVFMDAKKYLKETTGKNDPKLAAIMYATVRGLLIGQYDDKKKERVKYNKKIANKKYANAPF